MQSTAKRFKSWTNKFGDARHGHVSSKTSVLLADKNPPKSHDSAALPIVLNKISELKTSPQPKHIIIKDKRVFVSCIEGRCVDIFQFSEGNQPYLRTIKFSYPCIHSELIDKYLYTTLTSFSKAPFRKDIIAVTDLASNATTYTTTKGKWSKVIAKNPKKPMLFVSNWFSNDVSIFDVHNPSAPKFVEKVTCGISPRGIAFSPKGNLALIACYYSRNIIEIGINDINVHIKHIGNPYDFPNYSGNMRDIAIDSPGTNAYISNMGRNLVHKYCIECKEITKSCNVGSSPNSIHLKGKILLVNCCKSNCIYVLNAENMSVLGISEKTLLGPVGLGMLSPNIYITTSFGNNCLEIWSLNKHKINTQS